MFTQKEKREHYNAVARKEKPVKDPSRFSPQTQLDYARGQAHARNEAAAIFKHNNSTPEEREGYKQRMAIKREATLTSKCKVCSKPCDPKYAQCYACYKAGHRGSAVSSAPTPVSAKTTAPKTTRERKCKICKQAESSCCC